MPSDEDAIRHVVRRWQEATRAGDVQAVLSLMTDDVVFLVVGREPFGKQEFAAMSATASTGQRPTYDAQQRIDEIHVSGDVAYMRSHIHIKVIPTGDGVANERAGYTLSVFRNIEGRWLLARDANLLTR